MKKTTLIVAIALFGTVQPVWAQAPGWFPTGEWVCKGGLVRIISSTDRLGAVDFEIKGAWFDNHYTLRRGGMFYNGEPCVVVGDPMAFVMYGNRGSTTGKRTLTVDEQLERDIGLAIKECRAKGGSKEDCTCGEGLRCE
jgi:hypothetical protein